MAQTIGRFAYGKLAKYPHMKPADVRIWERFVADHRDFFVRVDYDFHVGKGADFRSSDESTPDGRENRLYQKKIDVVGYREDSTTLIEVKPIADVKALGQILTYKELYMQNRKGKPGPHMLVICEKIMAEMKDVYKGKGISVVVA